MTFCVDVVTADASKLKNRGLAYAFTSSPYIITAFAGSAASETFYHDNWRWGFGCFAIIFPIVALPLFFILKANIKKAQKLGNFIPHESGRTWYESIWHYTVDFDSKHPPPLPKIQVTTFCVFPVARDIQKSNSSSSAVLGVVLFSVGLVLFLLPFDIADSAPHGWASGYIIAMLVVGFVLLMAFGLFEKFVAPVPLVNYHFLTDRTVLGACLLDATYQVAYYCWDNYFTSYLQVVNDVSVAEAGYISNTFNVVSGVLLFGVGWLMRRTGRFRWLLYIAVPLYIFAQGLMIYFRRPNQSVGYQIMCQIFISIGGSVFIIVQQVAVLAAVDHQHVAAALALLYVIGTIGDAIGAAVSGAIWTNTFPNALEWYLPESAQANFTMIYEDLDTQLSYPVGSETRLAIQHAYGYAQTRMLAAGTGIMALAFVWVFLIRDINLNKMAQVKGMVF